MSFNQGINARFLTDEAAAAIAGVEYRDDQMKERRIYTAWDNRKDEERLFAGPASLSRLQGGHAIRIGRDKMVAQLAGASSSLEQDHQCGCRESGHPLVARAHRGSPHSRLEQAASLANYRLNPVPGGGATKVGCGVAVAATGGGGATATPGAQPAGAVPRTAGGAAGRQCEWQQPLASKPAKARLAQA